MAVEPKAVCRPARYSARAPRDGSAAYKPHPGPPGACTPGEPAIGIVTFAVRLVRQLARRPCIGLDKDGVLTIQAADRG